MKILVTIPTLGLRLDTLKMTITSLLAFIPEAMIEIRTPNPNLVSDLRVVEKESIEIKLDESDQRSAILNSWNKGDFDWYTWINDDDFALAGVEKAVGLLKTYQKSLSPQVIYGNLAIMDHFEIRKIKTPKFINTWLLASGADYVPGVLTFINRASSEILIFEEKRTRALRNSFDYQWWLQLADSNAHFHHSEAIHAIWRDHPLARTRLEMPDSQEETEFLKGYYLPNFLKKPGLSKVNTVTAKIIAKLSANSL